MPHRRAVALLIETSNAYARGLLRGIIRYVREQHHPWSVYLPEQGRGGTPPDWLARWRGDGIIARIENEVIGRAVTRTGLPVVDMSAARMVPDVAWVETDDKTIARLAVEHLLERGFRNLAYCGNPAFNWSNWRGEYFSRTVHEHGLECHVFQPPDSKKPRARDEGSRRALAKWVRGLPKPVGVLACYDIQAQQLLEVCRDEMIPVPEVVAVLGVDNDELLCHLAVPPLSSVIPDTERTGYEAAEILDQLMSGKKVSTAAHRIEPLGIATRQSTDVLAVDDPDVASALRLIREHACDGWNVEDVLKQVPVSRRVLERRFLQILGRTPHKELLRLRLQRVRELLVETDLNLSVIAERSGFRHVEYLTVAFKHQTGVAPSRFREQHRRG